MNMKNEHKDLFYIDLFDDGIPKSNLLVKNISRSSTEKQLLDAARFQILISILFERQIVVPESWAISSPTFLRLFSEIKQSYPDRVNKIDSAGIVTKAPMFPFVFSFFSTNHSSPLKAYLSAFINRLENGKRVQCLTDLRHDSRTIDQKARLSIVNYLKDVSNTLNSSGVIESHKFSNGLWDSIYKGLEGSPNTYEESSVAFAITNIVDYLGSHRALLETQYWEASNALDHTKTVQENVLRVYKALHSHPKMDEIYPSQTHAFREFFEESKRKDIIFSDIMGMWDILKNYDDEIVSTAEAFGRYALNRGYENASGAGQSTLSFDYYCQGTPSQFAYELLGNVAALEHKSHELGTSFSKFIEMAPSQEYDLDDTIEWRNAWESAAILASSEQWREKRLNIENNIVNLIIKEERLPTDVWCELFDDINAEFQDLSFKVVGGDQPTVRLLKKAKDSLELIKDGATVAGKFIELASASLVPLSIFMKRLDKHIPTRVILKSIRTSRKFGQDFRMQKNNTKLILP